MRPFASLLAAGTVALLPACHSPSSPGSAAPLALQAGKKATVSRTRGSLSSMPVEMLFTKQQTGQVLVYDVRPGFVAAFGKVPGSVSWPKGEFEKQAAQREREIRSARAAGKVVVLYCTDAACPDARAVAEKLASRGHDIAILDGGYAAWESAGMETE